MSDNFTKRDLAFLKRLKITAALPDALDAAIKAGTEAQFDGTEKILQELGLPLTRENYLRLEFAGNPPEEPLDGEIEAELPEQFQFRTKALDACAAEFDEEEDNS
jgi:hypothetical protein